MQHLKHFCTRKNLWFLVLVAAEVIFLLARFASDYGAGTRLDVTPDLIIPYTDQAVNDDRGTQVENYVGQFATTRWLNLEAGSYQVVVTYANNGNTGTVRFLDEVMPTAQYDVASLPPGRSSSTFTLWMEHPCDVVQLQFYSDCGEDQVTFITDVQIIPTHSFAYVHFLTVLALFAAIDWLILVLTRRVALPWRTVKARYSALAVVVLVAVACLPLGLDYIIYGHDLTVHLTRIEGLKAGLLAGQFPVRMNPDIVSGKGYPFSLMYADLLLYPAAILRILGFSLQTVYKLYLAGITLATALITRYVLRRIFNNEMVALAGTALYLLAPYRLTNVYVRASVGEYSAMLFLPLVVYGLWLIYRQDPGEKPRPWCWLPLALGFTGLLQTHLLTSVMTGFLTAVFCLVYARRTFRRPVLLSLCKAALVAVVWNLWFLVPLAQYMIQGVCHISGRYDAANLQDSTVMLGQMFMLFGKGTGTAQSIKLGMEDEMPLALGTTLGLGALALIAAMLDPAVRKSDRKATRISLWALGFGALCVWMASDLFPWYGVYLSDNPLVKAFSSLLGKLQFSWRFLSPASFLLTVCTAGALALLWHKRRDLARQTALVLVLLTLIPAGYLMYDTCDKSAVVHYISLGSMGVSSPLKESQLAGGEYLPYDLSDKLSSAQFNDTNFYFEEGVEAESYARGQLSVTFTATNTNDAQSTVVVPLFAYPGYELTDTAGTARLSRQDGYLIVLLPAGYSGTITLRFTGFWFWHVFDLVSLAGVAATVVLWRRHRRQLAAR
ncbi:hypothetical protein H6B15_04790 [Gemmiger formicilis]|uniref:hypothetical protein n=1 Tax=Gemmiger formicilis TaxID=745368 RepID=UPI001956AC0B|nr:hypothetical protein [Gemmiger formicilis]MBM6715975.1 hypothetical protein [Gemmiger formicilis]